MKTIRFKSLSSGSCGNCYFLGIFEEAHCEAGILIDAGVSPRRLRKELQYDNLGLDDFSGILITHDHYDHIRSLGSYCKHLAKPVWTTPTLHQALCRHFITGEHFPAFRQELAEGWNELVPGRIRARWFEVPHDASQTVGYAILLDDYKFVIMTDIGRMTPQALSLASQADTVVIESNYDDDMLRNGPYPKELQDRIRGGHGHLSNRECAEAVGNFAHEGLRNIFLCHLSEHNNTPELALQESRRVLDTPGFPGSPRLVALPRQTATQIIIL